MNPVKAMWLVSLRPRLSCCCADHSQLSQTLSLSGVDCFQALKEWGFHYCVSYWNFAGLVHCKLILMFLTLLFLPVNTDTETLLLCKM